MLKFVSGLYNDRCRHTVPLTSMESVHFISSDVDLGVMLRLSIRDDGQEVDLDC